MFSKTRSLVVAAAGLSLGFAGLASAAAVGVDGSIGADWTGVSAAHVTHDASAPENNFGTPGPTTTGADYDIYVRDDGSYYYVGVKATGNLASSPGTFANLYLDTNPSANDGSDLGFEVTNSRAFIPGVPGYFNYTPGANDISFASSADTIEFAVPNSFFTTDPLAMGFPKSTDNATVRLSQSFGYSVAGGATYGVDRLGTATVAPEPGSATLLALGAAGLLIRRRKAS